MERRHHGGDVQDRETPTIPEQEVRGWLGGVRPVEEGERR